MTAPLHGGDNCGQRGGSGRVQTVWQLVLHRVVLGPFLHFAPNLVFRNRPLAEDGPIVEPEPESPAEDRPDRPEIASRG